MGKQSKISKGKRAAAEAAKGQAVKRGVDEEIGMSPETTLGGTTLVFTGTKTQTGANIH